MKKLLTFLFLTILPTLSQAKYVGTTDKETHEWFEKQYNGKGQWCCNDADGHPYYDGYTLNPDGSIILSDGRKVEPFQVLKGSNPTGKAILWTLPSTNEIRCFIPGTLT